MQNILDKDFLTQKEAADYLRVSVGTVINRRKNGLLPFLRFPDSRSIVYSFGKKSVKTKEAPK